ncbi:MAG: hypothetical protein H0U76_07955 [Ktedonobacteraceae bacterium]|nr:hypothetical protein [Ktedonobacteraceae bacterium]
MTTAAPKRAIFRNQALQKYRQNQEKSVLPRIIAPPVFLFFWILLLTLTAAGVIAWLGQVPLYVTGSGTVIDKDVTSDQNNDEATAIIILPASEVVHIHAGLPAQVQIGSTGPQVNRTIDSVSSSVLSPSEVRQNYGVMMTDPAQVVFLKLGPTISRRIYAGSPVHVQIQIGSQRLISLFPIFNNLWKEV